MDAARSATLFKAYWMPIPPPTSASSRTASPVATPGLQLYKRLVGYAWRYKARLLVALCFALVVAFSLGSLLFGLVNAVELIYFEGAGEGEDDLAVRYASRIGGFQDSMNDTLGLGLAGWDEAFLSTVRGMREDKVRALFQVCGVALVLALLMAVALFVQVYFAGLYASILPSFQGS